MSDISYRRWGWIILLTSMTTLLCCALPIVLVTLGLGAASAALFANAPFLVPLAQHKGWLFSGAGALLVAGAWALYRPGRTCPADPVLARQCADAERWNRRFLVGGFIIWLVGFAAAYLALPVYRWLG